MMYGAYEGDLVRPLGFVTLHSAYAEGELDDLIATLPADRPYDDKKRGWPVGAKVSYALRLVMGLRSHELEELRNILDEAKELFSRRNKLVHGRLFAGGRLVSNRLASADRRISQDDIVRLAEDLFNWKERLWVCRYRKLIPLLELRRGRDDA